MPSARPPEPDSAYAYEHGPDMDAWRAKLRAAEPPLSPLPAKLPPPSSPLRPSLARASSSVPEREAGTVTDGRDDPFGFLAAERRRRSRRQVQVQPDLQVDNELRPQAPASDSPSDMPTAPRARAPPPVTVYHDHDHDARPLSRSSSIFPATVAPLPALSHSAASEIPHRDLSIARRPASNSSSRGVLRQKDSNLPGPMTDSSTALTKTKTKPKPKATEPPARQRRKKRAASPAVAIPELPAAGDGGSEDTHDQEEVALDPEEEKLKRIAYFKAVDDYELHKEDVYII